MNVSQVYHHFFFSLKGVVKYLGKAGGPTLRIFSLGKFIIYFFILSPCSLFFRVVLVY